MGDASCGRARRCKGRRAAGGNVASWQRDPLPLVAAVWFTSATRENNRTMNGAITVGLLRVIHILAAAMAVARYVS